MVSATISRPAGAINSTSRSTRFGELPTAVSRHNSDERPTTSSTPSQTYSIGRGWQPSSEIWGNKTIGSGLAQIKKDASRPGASSSDDFPGGPSGSAALTASSDADPWSLRAGGPWNAPDTTSPTLQSSHSGSTSPTRVRGNLSTSTPQKTLLEVQQSFSQMAAVTHNGGTFTIPQFKSSLDPSSGSFKFTRKSSFGLNDDKENTQFPVGNDPYEMDLHPRTFRSDQLRSHNSGFLDIGNSVSRDGSMPPSRASDSAFNGGAFGNDHQPFASMGHTPNNSVSLHAQRPPFSLHADSFPSLQAGRVADRASFTEADLRQKLAVFGLDGDDESSGRDFNNNLGSSYKPNDVHQQSFQLDSESATVNDAQKPFSYQDFSSQAFADQLCFKQSPRYGDRGSASPAGSDYRRSIPSPRHYSAAGTPPSEYVYRPGSHGPRMPQATHELDRRPQSVAFPQQPYPYNGQYASQFHPNGYDFTPSHFRPYAYSMHLSQYVPHQQMIPTRPAKDQDAGHGLRSVLLEEFRANAKSSSRRYELREIYDHVVEFSGDQHGSRFIQGKLETANSDEKEVLFREIKPNTLQLSTDVFGNYVIQKLFEHGNQVQKRYLAEQMKNHVIELSTQTYGCRVVQKALEHVLADQQAELVNELKADILRCIKDQNGNHVVQKAIERVPAEHIQFILDAFKGQVHVLATHAYGCRVIQRILDYCKPQDQASILVELHQCAPMLITDQYGNYVTQHVIQHGTPEDRARIIKIVTASIFQLSKHKYASNVVEKSITFGTPEQRQAIVSLITAIHNDGTSTLQLLIKDQFGNYVIQRLLEQLKDSEREDLIAAIRPQLNTLKKFNYGKQISAIEKLIFVNPHNPTHLQSHMTSPTTMAGPTTQPISIDVNSSAPTPSLTNTQNSPQSSSLPSTSASTIEEPVENGAVEKNAEVETQDDAKMCPDVVVNGV